MIGEYIKREFNVTYSLQGVANLAHRLNLSYTMTTYTSTLSILKLWIKTF
ncbi:winged helix-turn-helix domain-containing protein [Paenibacillus sp. MZ04-78.2]